MARHIQDDEATLGETERSTADRILRAVALGLLLLAIIYLGCFISADLLGVKASRDVAADPVVVV